MKIFYLIFFFIAVSAFGFTEEQIKNFEQKAIAGDSSSQLILGIVYLNGKHVSKNIQKAVQWLNKAAENNNQEALYSLGKLYSKGQGGYYSKEKALTYFEKAARLGEPFSQYELAQIYIQNKSYFDAYIWLTVALQNDRVKNKNTLQTLSEVKNKLNSAQLKKAVNCISKLLKAISPKKS